jgi:hypothetical protein
MNMSASWQASGLSWPTKLQVRANVVVPLHIGPPYGLLSGIRELSMANLWRTICSWYGTFTANDVCLWTNLAVPFVYLTELHCRLVHRQLVSVDYYGSRRMPVAAGCRIMHCSSVIKMS